jgi:hypothetical protein
MRSLVEREDSVAGRERQLEELRSELARLAAALEARAAHDREAAAAGALRVAKEGARVEALQVGDRLRDEPVCVVGRLHVVRGLNIHICIQLFIHQHTS